MSRFRTVAVLVGITACLLLTASPASADLLTDPVGDTFGVGPVQHDIISYGGDRGITPGAVVFKVNFAGAIAPASAFAPNSVVGFFDIDADQNAATGATPFINVFGPPPPINLGDEFFIDVGSEAFHPGLVDIVDALTNIPTGQAPITFAADGFFITVPLSLFPGANTDVNFGMIFGTFNEPTDRAPNGVDPATTIPEPGSVYVFAMLLAGTGCFVYSRRRRLAGVH